MTENLIHSIRGYVDDGYILSPFFDVRPEPNRTTCLVYKRVVGGFEWVRYQTSQLHTCHLAVEVAKKKFLALLKINPAFYEHK
jgi:hypothetical protein